MRARSAQWDQVVSMSHRQRTRVSVRYGGQTIVPDLAVESGEVVFDRSALIRGRCRVRLSEPTLVPVDSTSPLSPFGAELVVERGIVYSDGTEEMMPWGVFPIQESTVDGRGLVTELSCMDRSQLISDARLESELTIAAGFSLDFVIFVVLTQAMPGLIESISVEPSTFTVPAMVCTVDEDPWRFAVELAQSGGCELAADETGRITLRAEPIGQQEPSWSVTDGEGGILTDLSVSMTRNGAANRVVAVGRSPSAQYRAVATDNDPSSPTFYDGPFGRKTLSPNVESVAITSTNQAQAAANARLAKVRGVPKQITFDAIPNPAVQLSDSVHVRRSGLVDEIHVLDRLALSLDAGGRLSAATRQVATL